MSHLTVLIGDKPSTKHYTIDEATGRTQKGKVSTSYYHDSYTVPIDNLADMYEALEVVREDPNAFIIRGRGREDMMKHIRRTKDDPANFFEEATQWICFDFDGLTEINLSVKEFYQGNGVEGSDGIIGPVIKLLPPEFHNVDCIYQWSSSAGLYYNDEPIKPGINLHLFFWLDRPVTDKELTAWFKDPVYKHLIDVSVFRTMTPIFVGNHIVKDDRIVDVIPDDAKFGIWPGWRGEVKVPEIDYSPLEQVFLSSLELPEGTTDAILQQLYALGAIYKSSGSWFKLKHPGERTPGDWHIAKADPKVVHHHVHKSKRIDNWIRDFYHIDPTFDLPLGERTGADAARAFKQHQNRFKKLF